VTKRAVRYVFFLILSLLFFSSFSFWSEKEGEQEREREGGKGNEYKHVYKASYAQTVKRIN